MPPDPSSRNKALSHPCTNRLPLVPQLFHNTLALAHKPSRDAPLLCSPTQILSTHSRSDSRSKTRYREFYKSRQTQFSTPRTQGGQNPNTQNRCTFQEPPFSFYGMCPKA